MSKLSFLKDANASTITEIFQKRLNHLDALRAQRKTVHLARANKICNRYSDILPFDENIVKLENGYINASYMTSLYGNSKYIMAQGPLPHTVQHFWEMVWNENCYFIIMLTPEKEGSKVKCHKYWQDGQSGEFSVNVESKSAAPVGDTTLRKIKLARGGQERIVYQVHFIAWPDHQQSNPEILIDLIAYCNRLAKDLPSCSPIVHCSAGVGRSVCFTVSNIRAPFALLMEL
jgi:protein tyrosine phosphatase